MDVDLVRLRYFATVADHLHFGRAAAELHLARPVLSRAITELEAELGVELFVRPSERTALTDAGRALLERARSLLAAQDLADAAAEAVGAAGTAGVGAKVGAGDADAAFTVGIVAGVTVSKWTRLWAERRPDLPVRVRPTDARTQVTALHDGVVDVSFVRLPVEREGLSTIGLYSEVPVVVVPTDHPVTLFESVAVADLVEEHLLQDPDTVPAWRDAALARRTGARRPLPAMESTADAIALVAAGLGIVIVPQSVARVNHRKDVTYRTVTDVPGYDVALAWLAERTTPEIEEFIGIVRGRSPRSSRSPESGAREPAPPAGARPRSTGAAPTRAAPSSSRRGARASSKPRRPRGRR